MILTANKYLADNGHIPEELRIRYRLTRPEGSETYCPSIEEVTAVIDHCRGVPSLNWFGDVLFVLTHSGLRFSEAAGLRWSDIDFRGGMLTLTDERASSRKKKLGSVRTIKGRRGRRIPLHSELACLLQAMPRSNDCLVLHDSNGMPLYYETTYNTLVDEVLPALAKRFPTPPGEVGLESTRLHSFRHYFCSLAFLGGAGEGEVMEWMGHTSSKMVALYRHLRADDSRRRMEQIKFLKASPVVPGAM